jgi:mannose-6-phosphate isomerase-like protein (cupin superfamily)
MVDLTRTKTREQEAAPASYYDIALKNRSDFVERGMNGQIVRRDSDIEFESGRQGVLKYYLMGTNIPEAALQDWMVFVHDVKKESGKHRHQGGLVLFILEGRGATEVNGEVIEWEKGDCVLLPLHPDGVDHKHFNRGAEPAKWLAFLHIPTWDNLASEMTQTEINPDFKK